MRIDNQHLAGVTRAYNQQQKQALPDKADVQKKDDDKINLSPEAKVWNAAFQAVREQPEDNGKKIERISEALNKGTYHVSNEEIAEKLWQESIFDKKV